MALPGRPKAMKHDGAVVMLDGDWWIGWVEEVPVVNARKPSRDALLASLKTVLLEAPEMNRAEPPAAPGGSHQKLALALGSALTICRVTSANRASPSCRRAATMAGHSALDR